MIRLDRSTMLLLAALGCMASNAAEAARRPRHQAVRPHMTAPKPAPAAGSNQSNLVVRGQRFRPAPMPDQAIHDPTEAVRDPSTGAAIGQFGGAYIDANPVPPVNTGPPGTQEPISAGIRH